MFNASRRRRTSALQIAAFVLSVSLFAPLVGLTGCSGDEGYGQIPFPSATAEATDGGPRPIVTNDGDDNTSDDEGLGPGTTSSPSVREAITPVEKGRMRLPFAGEMTSMGNRRQSRESLPRSVLDLVIPARSENRAT